MFWALWAVSLICSIGSFFIGDTVVRALLLAVAVATYTTGLVVAY